MVRADVIVDLQAGDCGKGKIAHALAPFHDAVMRYNGGSNAGHTIYHKGQKLITHQVPSGVLHGLPSIIGPECVVNVSQLIGEILMLEEAGIPNVRQLVWVDRACHLVLPKHIAEDMADTKIGTTKQGIGPAYAEKVSRTGMRIADRYPMGQGEFFRVVDVYDVFHAHPEKYFSEEEPHILCEGAQGFQLDINHGDYPYVTASHCVAGAVCLNGIPTKDVDMVIGVMKAYETYVGNRLTTPSEFSEIFKKIQAVGNEVGATTGRPRQVNWLNLDKILPALVINGVDQLYINKLDVLEDVGEYRYIRDGALHTFTNVETFIHSVEHFIREKYYGIPIIWSRSPSAI